MGTKLLLDEYRRCIDNITQTCNYIMEITKDDLDKADLYRTYLHITMDRAIQLKKLLIHENVSLTYEK